MYWTYSNVGSGWCVALAARDGTALLGIYSELDAALDICAISSPFMSARVCDGALWDTPSHRRDGVAQALHVIVSSSECSWLFFWTLFQVFTLVLTCSDASPIKNKKRGVIIWQGKMAENIELKFMFTRNASLALWIACDWWVQRNMNSKRLYTVMRCDVAISISAAPCSYKSRLTHLERSARGGYELGNML